MAGSQLAVEKERSGDVPAAHDSRPFIPIILDDTSGAAAIRLCVMLRHERSRSYPIVIRESLDARVFLGGLIDQAGTVHRLLEIHVQHTEQLSQSPAAYRDALTNALLDERWQINCRAMAQLHGGDTIRTRWEHEHPTPMLIDIKTQSLIAPKDRDGVTWRLCEDDALLRAHGLPAYATSLHRYLVPDAAGETKFIPVTADAPENEHTLPHDHLWHDRTSLLPFNLGCGLMFVRSFDRITYEAFVETLSGTRDAIEPGGSGLGEATLNDVLTGDWIDDPESIDTLPESVDTSEQKSSFAETALGSGRLFLGRQSDAGRLLETLHLKLRVFSDAANSVAEFVNETRVPMLNIRAENFRVRLGPRRSALPFFWTARTVLTGPSEAVRLPLAANESSEHDYFLADRSEGMSIYTPGSTQRATHGRCSMRIRQIIQSDEGEVIAEGTFSTHDRVQSSRGDLVIMRVPIDGKRFELYATMDADEAMASGEWRFRSNPIVLRDRDEIEMFRRSEGVLFDQVEFDLVPLLSTPHDLYALGVLATRTLLVNEQTTLSKALDEMLSLARRVASEHDPNVGLPLRIFTIFDADSRWHESLGPHRLTSTPLTPDEARAMIPDAIWWKALAMIVRTFPGIGPDSICRDFSDCPPGGPGRVFDPLLDDVQALLLEVRNLTTFDWMANREIHEIVASLRSSNTDDQR